MLLLYVGLIFYDLSDDLCVTWQDFPFQTLGKRWQSLFNFDLYERIRVFLHGIRFTMRLEIGGL